MLSERDLVRCEYLALRCRQDDVQAASELVAFFQRPLLYYLRRLTGSEHDAWDVSQDTWCSVFRSLHKLREPRALPSFIYRIARNHALQLLNRRGSAEVLNVHAELPIAEEPTEESFAADDALQVHRCLDELSLAHREVLTLHFLEDLSIKDIADTIGVPPGTVKSRLHFAKRALRERLQRSSP